MGVLQAHRDYWYKVKGTGRPVPSLDIYIVDLYPTVERGTPLDPDSINNRVQIVLFHDKSKHDEKSATMVSDYVNIINSLMKMLQDKDSTEGEIYNELKKDLENNIVSVNRNGETRNIEDLKKERFAINKLLRIGYGEGQQLDDSDDIYGKSI